MALTDSFIDPAEQALAKEFLDNGYVVKDVDDRAALDAMRAEIVRLACEHRGDVVPDDHDGFLNTLHERVAITEINPLRLHVFNGLNQHAWCRPTYLKLARSVIDAVVGNELAMQNKVNLSIQMPRDETSTLAVHADVWSAETPFEVVEWTPLVDVYDTKAMYILPPAANRTVRERMSHMPDGGKTFDLFAAYKDDFQWIAVPYGKTLVFSPILLHGNVRNDTDETRWSLNCRLTGLFTPYTSEEKCLGRFYTPITPKVASRVGMNFKPPEGFDG
ncbi:MAG: phytanoyl-CoA dioxygenase family protein [Alphaproteobacteria bacterium]|nr:phytanoyl-CoA dioxygenase family protein [Alphaproteobacteria bacterium]